MKKFGIILSTLLMFSAAAVCAQNDTESTTLLKKGMSAPAFTVQMVDGTTLSSEELQGKVVMLNFWATWCPPCRKEFKRLQKDIIDRFAGEDFILLPIAIDEDPDNVLPFLKKNGYTFPVAVDPGKKVYGMFAERYIPRNFVIGRDGKIALVSVGYEDKEFDQLIKNLETLLNE